MIEEKLRKSPFVELYINFPKAAEIPSRHGDTPQFVEVSLNGDVHASQPVGASTGTSASIQELPPGVVLRIEESRSMDGGRMLPRRRQSDIREGAHPTKEHRNFKWLPYSPGNITHTKLDQDVLTGPMSGCPLAIYTRSGEVQVAHIGTTENLDATKQVKALWQAQVDSATIGPEGGFDPFNKLFDQKTPKGKPGAEERLEVWGLVTTDRKAFAIEAWQQRGDQHKFRIGRVQDITLQHQVKELNMGDPAQRDSRARGRR